MKSMTGYGAATGQSGKVGLSVEIRSVNQRHREIKISAPREYSRWEADLRRQVAGHIGRGRVEVTIARTLSVRKDEITIRRDLVEAYLRAFQQLKRDYGVKGEIELSLFQGRGDIFQQRAEEGDLSAELAVLERLLVRALKAHTAARKREGAHLKRDLNGRLDSLRGLVVSLRRTTAGAAERRSRRLKDRVHALIGEAAMDESRLIQEAALLADRIDVTEELVRLDSHLAGLKKMLPSAEPVGKRFDFLLQEVARELNTIASKSGDVAVTGSIVEGKTEVEKLREQIQNVE